ncbi:NAC domain-containing protein 62 isoform X2 [Vitis vinifera]|uniref:NAC domain-containing protein 62 isoform X2 n=1 Tax=Vitis vinifera TaxID=29760 RepID=UPI00053F564E|nr:NAC domain-containing protein 62 isoform X2 [Vitis vinifera]|eukprot:XP_010661526.1 PREDICTED: NAC domain-containing protein 62-like isoform X3 [Vitis vinifera]
MSIGEMIATILETLPVGFRFYPTDEELVDNHLKLKILGMESPVDIIPEVDICKWEPWELPVFSVIKTDDPEWFFFSLLDYKYSNGSRSNRATSAGYWKPTGQDRDIFSGTNKEVIGTKKTLVFYRGRGRGAIRTNWVIHEYRANIAGLPANRAYVLCRLKRKTDENTGSDIPIPDEAVAGALSPEINFNGSGILQNGLANNMTLGAGPSHYASNIASNTRNYQVEDMTLEEDPQIQGLFSETTFIPLDSDFFSDTVQGPHLDLPFSNGFNNVCGRTPFQDDTTEQDDDVNWFLNTLIIDQDEHPFGELASQWSSGVDNGNLRHDSIGKLSAHPQSPLKGVHGKGGGSRDTEVPQVQYSQLLQASSLTSGLSPKECVQSPMDRPTSRLSSINQHRRENKSLLHDESRRFDAPSIERLDNFVAQRVAPKSLKLTGNASNNETLIAKLTKLSCSMTKPEEKSVSIKADDRTEHRSAIDLFQYKTIRESKKDCIVTEKANPKLSSIRNWPVTGNQKGSFNSLETVSASHEPSSSAGLSHTVVGGSYCTHGVRHQCTGFKAFAVR